MSSIERRENHLPFSQDTYSTVQNMT
uniref:Uncharacterized protein n=1 Tax=Anguilla anguilla TaxID=7936 RepID=A0A0E9XYF6_ANGAN